MDPKHRNLNRRSFLLATSAAMATPLLLDVASSAATPETAESGAAEQSRAAGQQTGKIYFIKRNCIGCQVCKTFCPAKAIRFGDCQNEIVQAKCLHCGTCYRECPISNISETEIVS